jgi:alanine dehydrogenase
MLIGIPKEIKDYEYRVGAMPDMVQQLVRAGHQVKVQSGAGARIGYTDAMYASAGAQIVDSPAACYQAEMILKVKEPQRAEYNLLQEGQVLFCYIHLAPVPELAQALIEAKVVAIAYETVTDERGHLPLLMPMSEIAGRMAIQIGATALHLTQGGRGILLGGVPGVSPGKVVVIGAGMAGTQAARIAMGIGADVTLFDINVERLRELDDLYGPQLKTCYSTPLALEEELMHADLVIGAVLVPGKSTPKIVTRGMIKQMQKGAVIVDISIDQGGCIETSRPTTHADPIFVVDGVLHYCVTNMPSACALTATQALNHATVRYALEIANKGYQQALAQNEHLRRGLNVYLGAVTHPAVAADLGYEYQSPEALLT